MTGFAREGTDVEILVVRRCYLLLFYPSAFQLCRIIVNCNPTLKKEVKSDVEHIVTQKKRPLCSTLNTDIKRSKPVKSHNRSAL